MRESFVRRARGAIGMGIAWALVWAPVAVLVGTTIIDPDNSMDEMWPVIGALPGFLGGVAFAAVLGVLARHRRFDELSIPKFALWGAAAGLAVGGLAFLVGEPTDAVPLGVLAPSVIGSLALMSAASAAGSLALARRAEARALTSGSTPRV